MSRALTQLQINALRVLPEGRLASASDDNTIRLWDVATGAATAVFKAHSKWVNTLCVLPDVYRHRCSFIDGG